MSEEKSGAKNILSIIPELVGLLEPLSVDERQRAISAALILVGQAASVQNPGPQGPHHAEPHYTGEGICTKAASWMKKNALTRDHLDHVFSIEAETIDIIAARMPEIGRRKQTIQAYLLCGIRAFLRTGDPAFADADARELCNRVGCYDAPNHATFTNSFGNLVTGSKESGWKLTNPGLSAGASVIKQLVPDAGS